MFILANRYSFAPDEKGCWLHASSGYGSDFSWNLSLSAQTALTDFPRESVKASFGIGVEPPLGVKHWKELSGERVEISREILRCGLRFSYDMSSEWEDLTALDLRFGQVRDTQLEIWATGSGSVEAATEIFPEGVVEFQVHTWVSFRGVAINVPLNVADPVLYSESRIRAWLPQYQFLPPQLRRTSDNTGVVRAVEVLLSPTA